MRSRAARGGAVLLALSALAGSAGQDPAPGQVRIDTIPGTEVAFAMVYVPGGELPPGRRGDAVTGEGEASGAIAVEPFWMEAHEVTHDEYDVFRRLAVEAVDVPAAATPEKVDAVTRPSPPYEDPSHGMPKGRHPATGMTRWAALQYARWLSLASGRLYRLPTEVEWEYACRAGDAGADVFVEEPGVLAQRAWFEVNSHGSYHEVGMKEANAFGVHDLLGNVAEWVLGDPAADPYVVAEADRAPEPVRPGGRGVVRGGAFDDPPERLLCSLRQPESPAWKRRDPQVPKSRWWNTDAPHVGFRLVSPVGERTEAEVRAFWDALLVPPADGS